MKYLIYITYTVLSLVIGNSALPNELNTKNHFCISCVCHARTGCYSLQNCANYSISYDYWEKAGAPTLSNESDINLQSYRECMADDNCIINTMLRYAVALSQKDCICDEDFNCLDRLSLHLYGEDCNIKIPRVRQLRYNRCARRHHLPQLNPNIECVDVNL